MCIQFLNIQEKTLSTGCQKNYCHLFGFAGSLDSVKLAADVERVKTPFLIWESKQMSNPAGISLIKNFISISEEKELLSIVSIPGTDSAKAVGPSRMFRFGELIKTEGIENDTLAKAHGYSAGRRSYGTMNDGTDVSMTEIPEVVQALGERLVCHGILDKCPPIYVFNKYLKGGSIGKHIDHLDNGPVIPVLGLKSGATMKLTKGKETVYINFPERALLTLTDAARYEWYHEIMPCKSERYALVFRNLPK